jgi:hypothetical protein
MFSRAEKMKPCPMGDGSCCKWCHMGPCRLVGKDRDEKLLQMVSHGTVSFSWKRS